MDFMKTPVLRLCLLLLIYPCSVLPQNARMLPEITQQGKGRVNTMVDNIGYWTRMVQLGYVSASPVMKVPPSGFTGTGIMEYEVPHVTRHASRIPDSPDVPVTTETSVTQSENSVFIDPEDEGIVLNSNNSSNWISGTASTSYGADALFTFNYGQDWGGSTLGVNGNNSGDPSTAIGLNGWWYVGRIATDWGQEVSYSRDQGKTWTKVKVGQGPATGYGLLDKNHLCIDNSPTSPFKGNLYAAWTNFIPGDEDSNHIELVRSADQGLTWSSPFNISAAALGLKLDHGVNVQTGPTGEVYAAWSIYDNWPSDENAIGFARSVDGGGIFMPATRIMGNIKGIRASMTAKNMRVNSFPCMAVDNSNGPYRGTVYIVWANVGYPGINTGTGIDIYMIRSTDGGTSWSAPARVNQDTPGLGKQHFFPWITCDPVTGGVCVIYYDDRNLDPAMAAVFVSASYDGGNTWTDMQVSDYTFTPQPIPGLAFSYFGDYIGIQSDNMKVYPVWTDNHDGGRAMTYASPFDLGPNPNQPWVSFYSDSLSTVSGTGNVMMGNGDSLHLSLGLKNIGDLPADAVTAVISTASPYISVTDSLADYDAIEPGQVKIVPGGYTFRVSDTIPDNLMVRFNVMVRDTDSAWFSHFSVESHAPQLKINGITIADTIAGNHNGRLDAGETARVMIPISNTGDFVCGETRCMLATISPYLTLQEDSLNLDDLQPGAVKNAVFTLFVNPETPAGTGIDLVCTVRSGLYKGQRTFREMVSIVTEDWETNTFTKFEWKSGGAKPWVITSLDPWQGNYCSRSGFISNYQNSKMFLTYTSAAEDSISFYLSTSSEQDYDFLMFYIDAVLQGQWSGETPWMRVSFPVSAGTHTFMWSYQKDIAYTSGADWARVDFIAMPPPVLPVVDPGPDDTICAGRDVMLQASAMQYDSLKWISAGDGTFFNDTALLTTYTPGTTDLVTGNVTLRLTGFGTYGSSGKNKHIRINPLPVAAFTVFPRDTVCAGQSVLLTADTAGISAWHWTPGNFVTPEVSYDTSGTGGPGTHLVLLIVSNKFQCQNRDSVYLTFKNCTGFHDLITSPVSIYPNPGNGIFTIETGISEPEPVRLRVINEANEVVFRTEYQSFPQHPAEKINVTFLPDGVYLLSLTTTRGTTAHKLIIRK